MIFEESEGYPFFLQEWGKQIWDLAEGDTVNVEDVQAARPEVHTALDTGFFAARDEQATGTERKLLKAMADLGSSGPYRSGAIAKALSRTHQEIAPLRDRLIRRA